MTDLVVAPVAAPAVRYAVENWHYSATMPVGRSACFGAWEDGRYVGAVIFGGGASPDIGRRFGLARSQVCELTRVALREHETPVSRIVSQAVRQLRHSSPGLRLVVSFADPAHGHHGGVYQAMNWTYLGVSDPSKAYIHRATGRMLHQRVVTQSGVGTQFGRATRVHRRADCDPITVPGKHRYALGFDRATRRRLAALAHPYPPPAVEGSTGSRPVSGGEGRVRTPATPLTLRDCGHERQPGSVDVTADDHPGFSTTGRTALDRRTS